MYYVDGEGGEGGKDVATVWSKTTWESGLNRRS